MSTALRHDDPAEPPVPPEGARADAAALWVLGSGSKGNAVVVAHAGRAVLLDAGFELPELVARLARVGLHPWHVEHVVLSHGHRDHVLGAADGARAYGWTVWATLGTVWRWRDLREVPVRPFAPGDAFDAGPFRVRTAATPHDVDDSSALVVEAGPARIAYVTDLGEVPPDVEALLAGVHALVLESNHDPDLLRDGPYPPEVRRRVAGPNGHLANGQAAALLRAIAHPALEHVVLGHVSRHNNTPFLALAAARGALDGTPFAGTLAAAAQDAPLGPLAVRGG